MKTLLRLLLTFLLSGLNVIARDFADTKDVKKISPILTEKYEDKPTRNSYENSLNGNRTSYNFFYRHSMLQRYDTGNCRICGESNINDQETEMVIRGYTVRPPHKYPWMVALQDNRRTFCGGTIINEKWILTAAHCLTEQQYSNNYDPRRGLDPGRLTVAFLTHTTQVKTGPRIEAVFPHPQFSMSSMMHDIGLIKLQSPITCDEFKNPICLPPPGHEIKVGEDFQIAGWGWCKPGSQETCKCLQEAKVTNIEFAACQEQFSFNIQRLKGHYYCLIGKQDQTPCKGDSGGPLFERLQYDGKYYIFGITSMHSSEICSRGLPFTYTAVPKHMDWIYSVMNGKLSKIKSGCKSKCKRKCKPKCQNK